MQWVLRSASSSGGGTVGEDTIRALKKRTMILRPRRSRYVITVSNTDHCISYDVAIAGLQLTLFTKVPSQSFKLTRCQLLGSQVYLRAPSALEYLLCLR